MSSRGGRFGVRSGREVNTECLLQGAELWPVAELPLARRSYANPSLLAISAKSPVTASR